ncbi:Trp biosynthesis-associated membrane protein [Actinomadura roseirufa]|uniref:Trp biosynthesis-associated membrane protein n=1 Tax=Actinomadura roseirufa TaxID=2094049 RepID=UPI0010418DD3|nr:Trp biosynthesis-associated membrane protein [Actinomadura roseirufa]
MTPGRERGLAALLCAAGAGLALLAAGRTWVTVRAGDSITPVAKGLSGRDLGAAPGALGLAGLAGLAALFATAGRVRAAVGALIAAFGAGVVYASTTAVQRSNVLTAVADHSTLLGLDAHPRLDVNLWWIVSVTGGVVLAVAGLVVLARGTRWPGLSSRYDRAAPGAKAAGAVPSPHGEDGPREDGAAPHAAERDEPAPDEPAEPAAVDAAAMWRSLDRGEDPTARRDGRR